ncbi:MAG: hypothetical protein KGJ57_01915 [Sphingomonadales bacterium]|nr:hypothetical protein [Sphingomonadales bacterium]MDE2168166.1 hypothetical protein [Sphingomonadales bacterium]
MTTEQDNRHAPHLLIRRQTTLLSATFKRNPQKWPKRLPMTPVSFSNNGKINEHMGRDDRDQPNRRCGRNHRRSLRGRAA